MHPWRRVLFSIGVYRWCLSPPKTNSRTNTSEPQRIPEPFKSTQSSAPFGEMAGQRRGKVFGSTTPATSCPWLSVHPPLPPPAPWHHVVDVVEETAVFLGQLLRDLREYTPLEYTRILSAKLSNTQLERLQIQLCI